MLESSSLTSPLFNWSTGALEHLVKMSILMITVDFPPHKDGVSTVAREIAGYLADNGEALSVMGPADRGAREFDARQNYTVIRTPGYHWGYLRFFPLLLYLPFVLLRYRVRRIIAMNIGYGGILSYLLSLLFRIPYITFAYGFEFCKFENNFFLRRLYLSVYGRSGKVIAISNFVRQRLIEFGVLPEKIVILSPAVDPGKFCPAEVPEELQHRYKNEDRKILLSVSRLIERKGHDVVIRALPRVRSVAPQILYLIVGVGPEEKNLRRLISETGVEDCVEFLNSVPDEELLHLYNLSDVFIMVSREIEEEGQVEGFGIVYLEANACGKPVIGGRSGGVEDAIIDGVTGLLVDSLDVNDVAQALIKLLTDSAYAEELGKNGRKRVEEELNWKITCRKLCNYL